MKPSYSTWPSRARQPRSRLAAAVAAAADPVEQRADQVHRQREEGGGVPLGGDLPHRLQIAQLHGDRKAHEDLRGLAELGGGLELALGVDDLGPALALGLGLLGHRALHVLWQVDLLHLDRRDLHAPRLGVLVDDPLQLLVHLVAGGQQVVQLHLAEHAAQRGLGQLGRRVHVILDREEGLLGIDDAEEDDRVDLDRDVVTGDDVLGRHVGGHRAQADALPDLVDEGHQQDQAGAVALPAGVEDRLRPPAEPEDDHAFVLGDDAEQRAQDEQHHDHSSDHEQRVDVHEAPPSPAFSTVSVSPFTSTTRTLAPSGTGAPRATARHSSPCTSTCPSGLSAPRATPVCPTRAGPPTGERALRARRPAAMATRNMPAVAPTVGRITHHDTRKPISGASNNISEPSASATMPPIASTPWLTTLISAIISTIPNRISSSPA